MWGISGEGASRLGVEYVIVNILNYIQDQEKNVGRHGRNSSLFDGVCLEAGEFCRQPFNLARAVK